ncbi:hypothetical protein F4805DRAFT_455509 [Annulohypoxylon moriforme]|nr:hypothetical protein F4805DRAFT_455509 [Annulohypoxylon moriforme]
MQDPASFLATPKRCSQTHVWARIRKKTLSTILGIRPGSRRKRRWRASRKKGEKSIDPYNGSVLRQLETVAANMPGPHTAQMAMIGGAVVVVGVAVLFRRPGALRDDASAHEEGFPCAGTLLLVQRDDGIRVQHTVEHEVSCIGESSPG